MINYLNYLFNKLINSMSKINSTVKQFSRFHHENNNEDKEEFCDILSFPSNPEDLFTLQYPIGHGAFGSVYKAVHNSTNKLYAIKIIDYSKGNNKENNNMINYNYQSVQQETSLMRLVNQSNYVVKYYGSYFSRKSNTLWLILEYCSSGSAIDLMLSMDRTFSEVEVATIMEMVLKGLKIIHSKNLIHRDIKGANILLSEDGYAKLGDFGVGVQLLKEKYRNSKKGSPYWMSPQVASNLNYDFKTDIWSLGITCVELIEGEPPFSNLKPKSVMEKISKNPPKLEDFFDLNEHTDEFKSFIEHCLEIDPNKRYTADQLLKHEFITRFSKGRKYMINLIKENEAAIEKFRFESEEEYQKLLKNNKKKESLYNEDSNNSDEEEFFIGNINIKGTYQEKMNNDNLDSIDNKMKKFLKKNKKEEKEKEQKEDIKNIENKLSINDDKYESDKSIAIFGGESIIVPDNKSSLSKENGNIIILDKNIKKNPSNKNKSSNLKIIKNDELEIFSPKIIFNNEQKNNQEKHNEEKNILKMTISSGSGNNCNNSLYGRLTPNSTRDNSKRGNNEEYNGINIVSVKKEKIKTTNRADKDTYDILLNNINDELKTHRNKKPLEFENNSNDISVLNTKEDLIKEENIHDTDDEGFINEIRDYNNYFKGADIYHNKTMVNQYSQQNIYGRLKQIENKKVSNGNY